VRRWLVAWGPAATWAAVLFFLSSRSTLPVDLSSGLDKVAHFLAYLVLGFLLTHAAVYLRLPLLAAVALGWFYGALDEYHQSFVPGRDASFGDWVADAAGTVVGVVLFLLVSRKLKAFDDPLRADRAETKQI
jgi:VanZ family protein